MGTRGESAAAAVMGRTSAYTGQIVRWKDMMEEPKSKPELYNLQLRPTAEDFEKVAMELPREGVVAVPGKSA